MSSTPTTIKKPPLATILARALKLRCPRCAGDKLFAGLFKMNPTCSSCQYRYEREPGYFLGSTYVNYGVTSLFVTIGYVLLLFGLDIPQRFLVPPLAVFVVLFPLIFFRYARSLWMSIDVFFDSSVWQQQEEDLEE